MTPHKHVKLIKAWADGAEIEVRSSDNDWKPVINPSWGLELSYRIKPDCEYAMQYIQSEYTGTALSLYKDWLEGATLYITSYSTKTFLISSKLCDSPFDYFCVMALTNAIQKEPKQTTTQVLWVLARHKTGINRQWLEEGKTPSGDGWYLVPDCTREIEV